MPQLLPGRIVNLSCLGDTSSMRVLVEGESKLLQPFWSFIVFNKSIEIPLGYEAFLYSIARLRATAQVYALTII